MKYFVIADIHSFYDLMIEALDKSGFDINNPEHIIISLGDTMDRGNKPLQVISFLLDLYNKKRAILIRGNHEDLLEDLLDRGYLGMYDEHNGTFDTVYRLGFDATKVKRSKSEAYNDLELLCDAVKKMDVLKKYYKALIDFYETDNYVFTHGFIPIDNIYGYPEYKPNWRISSKYDWTKARFFNGISLCSEYNIKIPNKTIVVGHFHASYGHVRQTHGFDINERDAYDLEFAKDADFTPFYDTGIIAIDACTAYTKTVNVLVLDL